ncbi:UNKNOWN [Stylonychia lemnae]|uniref:Uncharacterized protein n=1 Tax=Stylonychia lemnae TaxID=5949 RepID=A0A078ARP6_STYLE|nr:UNKNOWN [Stylonychia lemnae]|eukprot:CDW83528.1 UNKNOWN [Stylonychia lemnae]
MEKFTRSRVINLIQIHPSKKYVMILNQSNQVTIFKDYLVKSFAFDNTGLYMMVISTQDDDQSLLKLNIAHPIYSHLRIIQLGTGVEVRSIDLRFDIEHYQWSYDGRFIMCTARDSNIQTLITIDKPICESILNAYDHNSRGKDLWTSHKFNLPKELFVITQDMYRNLISLQSVKQNVIKRPQFIREQVQHGIQDQSDYLTTQGFSTLRKSADKSVLNYRITQKSAKDLYQSLRNFSPRSINNLTTTQGDGQWRYTNDSMYKQKQLRQVAMTSNRFIDVDPEDIDQDVDQSDNYKQNNEQQYQEDGDYIVNEYDEMRYNYNN